MHHRKPEDREKREHPSYGIVRLTRVSGGREKLFGSSIENFTRLRLTVARAVVERDLCEDRVRGGEELLVVEMSATQFAEALLSVGLHEGTPCTLRYVGGEAMPPCPQDDDPLAKIGAEFTQSMRDASARVAEGNERVEAILSQTRLTVADRHAVRALVQTMTRTFHDHAAFAQKRFAEAAAATLEQTKGEASAYVSAVVENAGIAHLAASRPNATLALPQPKEGTP